MKKKAVFIDKDGTLIPDIPFNADPDLIVLNKRVGEGLSLLAEKGYRLVVVTNQPGIAHGYFTEKALKAVHERILSLLRKEGLQLAGFYYCPHHPAGIVSDYAIACQCRKPRSGMLTRAARDLDISLQASWMIGDILHDVEAGNRAGCRSILINNGNESEWDLGQGREPAYVASDLLDAAGYITTNENKRKKKLVSLQKHFMHQGR